MSEVLIGRAAAAWLASLGFEIYQEVQVAQGSRTADLIGVMGPLLVAVECKVTFGVGVIEQAEHWRRFAHYSWVAVPEGRTERAFAERVCRRFGVGVLYVASGVSWSDDWDAPVVEGVHAEYQRRAAVETIRGSLLEGQKTALPAGSRGGGRWTPFRQTCEALKKIVSAEPGVTLKTAIERIDHHYSAPGVARVALAKWIEAGKIPGVAIRREGRAVTLFPVP